MFLPAWHFSTPPVPPSLCTIHKFAQQQTIDMEASKRKQKWYRGKCCLCETHFNNRWECMIVAVSHHCWRAISQQAHAVKQLQHRNRANTKLNQNLVNFNIILFSYCLIFCVLISTGITGKYFQSIRKLFLFSKCNLRETFSIHSIVFSCFCTKRQNANRFAVLCRIYDKKRLLQNMSKNNCKRHYTNWHHDTGE